MKSWQGEAEKLAGFELKNWQVGVPPQIKKFIATLVEVLGALEALESIEPF